VHEHHDDYRRDRHDDAARFEKAYLREYVDAPPGASPRALMTASGMAGFATILHFLLADGGVRGPVLLGRRTYHECRQLVHRSPLGEVVVEVDESDPSAMADAVDLHRPEAVFVDALCNAKGISLPDLGALVRAMADRVPGAFLVVDTTGLSCAVQPFAMPAAGSLRVLTLESLTKYAQFGLDRVAAGMIVAGATDGELLDECREHLGTNASDLAPYLVPWPNRLLCSAGSLASDATPCWSRPRWSVRPARSRPARGTPASGAIRDSREGPLAGSGEATSASSSLRGRIGPRSIGGSSMPRCTRPRPEESP
jgi:cystathionine beta-lyase/cystathionine gamma-synthase